MKILILGISCVGKTTVGELLAQKIGFDFIDLDQVNKNKYGTIEKFLSAFPGSYKRAMQQKKTINLLIKSKNDCVIAITPLNYEEAIKDFLLQKDIIAFELVDTAENVFKRLYFTDENDNYQTDSEDYKMRYANHYMREVESDLVYYGNVYKNVKNKIHINGKNAEETADMLCDILREMGEYE